MDALLRYFGAMIPLTVIAIPVGLLGWRALAAWRRRRRPARLALWTAGADVAIVLVTALALALVLMPVAGARGSLLHLVPGTDVGNALGDHGSLWQVAGNLLLLAPLGALLPMRIPPLRSLGRVTLGAMTASMTVETVQYLIQAGRVTSTDDILLNTMGAAAGATLSRRWWRAAIPVIPQQLRRTVADLATSPVGIRRVPMGGEPSGSGVFRGELVLTVDQLMGGQGSRAAGRTATGAGAVSRASHVVSTSGS
ncbi:VanZ family protein [Amycolatopsis nigrescens]|uniref:VanZ family protein n=1 Tax=Amycolatopsis nigrescens TaxID=381445 RepID=UPI0003AA52B3|nr:VanZ family protein [Amycolatopsis nigrescens]